jgi:hypothetical protein
MEPIKRTTAHELINEMPTYFYELGDLGDLFVIDHAMGLALAMVQADIDTLTNADGTPVAIINHFRANKVKIETLRERLTAATGFIALIEPDPEGDLNRMI